MIIRCSKSNKKKITVIGKGTAGCISVVSLARISNRHDLEIEWGEEFPYLKPFHLGGTAGASGGTGWHANKLHILWQRVTSPQEAPNPGRWTKTEVTDQIGPCDTFGFNNQIPFSGCQISSGDTKIYLTRANQNTGTTYLSSPVQIGSDTTWSDVFAHYEHTSLIKES